MVQSILERYLAELQTGDIMGQGDHEVDDTEY